MSVTARSADRGNAWRLRLQFATWLVLILLATGFSRANAACTATTSQINLGAVSSLSVATASQSGSGGAGFACTGSVLSLISTNTITATIVGATNAAAGQPHLRNAITGELIPFVICQAAVCSTTHSVGGQIVWTETTFAGILGLFNAADATLPIHIRTQSFADPIAAGVYTGAVTIDWTWELCAIGLLGACIYETGSGTSVVNIALNVTNDCAIAAPLVDFGSAAFVDSFDPVTQALAIRCSEGAAYTVGLDDGAHFMGGRNLASGAGRIAYEIYFPAGSNTRWGSVGAQRVGSGSATTNAGAYDGLAAQTYSFRAEILSGQPTPPPGVYTDTVIVDVQF